MNQGAHPSVGVVIATHNRPVLMRQALASVLQQDYEGSIEVVVVFDRSEPDASLTELTADRRVRVLSNSRTPGLAGARNTGILALGTDLVAFCDDDDQWLPNKLATQVARLLCTPTAEFSTTAMVVDYDGRESVRTAQRSRVSAGDLVRSRMTMLHSSSFLFRREAMIDGFGLVEEGLPGSMGEDWDLLLRAARRHPIEHVDLPLVRIRWGSTSYFNDAWHDKNAAARWFLEHHPELRRDRTAASLQYGKLAFGHAVLGQRSLAGRCVWQSIRHNPVEPRPYLAMAVVLGVPGPWLLSELNRRGHGI